MSKITFTKYFLVGLVIVGSFSVSAFADLLCVKNNNPVNKKNRLKLKNALVVNETACPRGYREVLNTNALAGSTGAIGATGSQGVDGMMLTEPFFFRGSIGDEFLDDSNFKIHFPVQGIIAPTDLASDVATIVGRDCDQIETTFTLSSPPGLGSGWGFSLERISADNFGSGIVDAVLPICDIAGNSTSCTITSNQANFIEEADDYLLAKAEAGGSPNETKVYTLVRCLD